MLTPACFANSGDVTIIFGQEFKMNDFSGRNKAIAYAKQCGYRLNDRYTLEWPEFEQEMKAIYDDDYNKQYAVVVASTSPRTYMFMDAREIMPIFSID